MPESEPETIKKTEETTAAEKPDSEQKPATGRRPPLARSGKWAIILLSLLCVVLLGALFLVAIVPRLLERDVNKLLQRMAEGGGAEFRIKTISLSGAEVACKLTDTSGGTPRNVGGIGSFSIRFSPVPFLLDQTIDAIEIENCDVTADYSGGSISIPAYNIFAKSFQSGEPKEKSESAPIDDLNAVIPVKVGRISLSGSLSAEARGEDALDILHIPYAVTVQPDPEQGWNKLDCSLSVHFATNALQCRAVYLHTEKKVVLDLENFSLATTAMPGTVRSALPRGLRAGISLNAKAEIDLNSLNMEELENSSVEVEGALTLGYRTPEGLRINSAAPFSLKMIPRPIPTVKPMNPPRTEKILVFTLGAMKGEYDRIPFELSGIEANVSLRHRTLQGGFQLTVADSEPAKFSINGGLNSDRTGLSFMLDNNPLFKAAYRGVNVSFRPGKLAAEVDVTDGGLTATADFICAEIRAGLDGAAFDPELKGLTAFLRPESFSAHFQLDDGQMEASAELAGGELGAGFKGTNVVLKPETIRAEFETFGGETEVSAGLTGGELSADTNGIKLSFHPETLSASLIASNGEDERREISAELLGGSLLVELEGMTCSAEKLAFNASSDDGQAYEANAKVSGFQFRHDAAGLAYDAPELGLNAAYFDGVLSGESVCGDSSLSMPELNLLAKNLHWNFPFELAGASEDGETGEDASGPQTDGQPRIGKITLGDFEFNGVQAASLDGTIQWDDAARALRLKTDARLLSINGQIYADIVFGDAGVETVCGIIIPDQDADLSKDLTAFFPQFEEITCTGRLGGSAVYKLLPKATTGNAKFHIAGADLFIPEQKLEVRGIGLGFEVPEIAVLKSAPGQTLSFKSVKYDRIETGSGHATFHMEAPDTWQVENALLNWCNGHIRLGSITYRPGQTTTEAVLYCDRLELPIFLTQIGLGQISGSGSINGTIPVVLVQKTDALGKSKIDNIYFDDAFLFSTPGENGMIKGDLDEALLDAESGIEMELSRDALKDFSYSWVRMRMQSVGPDKENLKLSLQLDGRPNRALYYAFDENTASFVKSPTPCIFQGIRLDTNVNMYGKAMELVDYFQQIFSKAE
jgi:hypothetical protein